MNLKVVVHKFADSSAVIYVPGNFSDIASAVKLVPVSFYADKVPVIVIFKILSNKLLGYNLFSHLATSIVSLIRGRALARPVPQLYTVEV